MTTPPILIGVPELAVELGVDQSTVHRRIERGELTPFTTVNKRPLFHAEDVAALVRGEQTLPKEESGELPEVGTLWRFKSSKTPYRLTETQQRPTGTLVTLQTLDTGANTTLSVEALHRRCVFLGRLEGARS